MIDTHRVIVLNKFGQREVRDFHTIPRIGDTLDMFYVPMPKVKEVILSPSIDTIQKFSTEHRIHFCAAIVFVE